MRRFTNLVVGVCALAACGTPIGNSEMTHRTPLDGPYSCVTTQCAPGQVCVVVSAGSQCWVNDAGVDPYDPVDWSCVDMPASCNGVLSCDCLNCEGTCFGTSGDGRQLECGCI